MNKNKMDNRSDPRILVNIPCYNDEVTIGALVMFNGLMLIVLPKMLKRVSEKLRE